MTPKKDNRILYIGLGIVAYVMFLIVSLHIGTVMHENPEAGVLGACITALNRIESHPFDVTITSDTLTACGIGTVIFVIAVLMIAIESEKNARSMPGKESGSAKWNDNLAKYNKKFNAPYGKPTNDSSKNMLLSQNVSLGMESFKTKRNVNCVVLGGSGSGKSRFFIKPNILQANSSYVITDPSGELLSSMGKFLEEQGYAIKVFNLVDMEHSNCYNPFNYIRDDLGVVSMVNCLIKNTTPPGRGGGDPFWEKSETALLQALIFYLRECAPPEQQNFTSVMKLLRAAEVDENNLNKKSDLDRLFDNLANKNPKSIALKQYMTFKMGSGKTLKSILISCSVRLTVFNMMEIEALTGRDNIDLGSIGSEKQALFVVLPQADDTYNFLASLMYSQLYETLYFQAENEWPYSYLIKSQDTVLESVVKVAGSDTDGKGFYNPKEKAEELLKALKASDLKEKDGQYYIEYEYFNVKTRVPDKKKRYFVNKELGEKYLKSVKEAEVVKGNRWLPSHVSFLLDEFANIGQIPEFDKKMATMRKYEISSVIALQNMSQLKEIYDKKAESIVGNADSMVFLGSPEPETCKYISERLGSTTIVVRNNSRSRGARGSSSMSYNRSKRELMTPDEVSCMPDTDCIVFVRGQQPFYGPKYDYVKHKNYHCTGDADPKNEFNIKKINNRRTITETEAKVMQEKVKKDKAAEKMRNTSEVLAPNEELLKALNIKKASEIPSVLASLNSEPEINIRKSVSKEKNGRMSINEENKEEKKEQNKRDKSDIEEWTFTPLH